MITAIISLYNPDKKVLDHVRLIAEQADRVILCDNSKNNNRQLFNKIDGICYVGFKENLGLSKAFNRVLKDKKFNWKDDDLIIFFDQDSSIEDGHIKKLASEFMYFNNSQYKLGCLGPIFYNLSNDTVEIPKMKKLIKNNVYKVKNIITSSLITNYEMMKKVGFWNENIFLDFVDWDFCWRLQKIGYNCCITQSVILQHSVGNGERKVGALKLRVGAAFRVYYQTRDALYLLKESYIPLKMRIKLLLTITVRPIIHFFCLGEKKVRVKYYIKGIKDYKAGVRGEVAV